MHAKARACERKVGGQELNSSVGQEKTSARVAKPTIVPTPQMPNQRRARAYVIILLLPIVVMTLFHAGLILFAMQAESIPSERVELVEVASQQGVHEYSTVLADRLRGRHFAFILDRSVCQGGVFVNEGKLLGLDADDVFAFDRANRVRVEGCVERTPEPLQLWAHPKVFVEEARVVWSAKRGELRLEVRLRNTLANSASVSLGAREFPGWGESFFLGPETSQTRSFVLRLKKYQPEVRLEMEKYAEAVEGAYRHIRKFVVTRMQE